MLDDVTWRKMPIDILTNENMVYIENKMPEGHKQAPFMFYMAMLKKADNDGIFDLEDGQIFAQLMRVESTSIVFKVAGLMAQRKMIYHISDKSNKCLIADWDYPKGTQPRTLAERRAIVQRQIEESMQHKTINTFNSPEEEIENVSFICPDDDKKSKNVVINVFDDKKAKNVVKNTDDDKNKENVVTLEREIEREIRERDKRHTQERESLREGEKEACASAGYVENPAPAPAEKEASARENTEKAEPKDKKPDVSTKEVEKPKNKTSSAKTKTSVEQETGGLDEVIAVLEEFFVNNSFGYDREKGHSEVKKLATRIKALETKSLTGPRIAFLMADKFKTMHDKDEHWKGIPVHPTLWMKPTVWAVLLSAVGDKVKAKSVKSVFLEEAEKAKKECEEEQSELVAYTDLLYKEYGIDPSNPNRATLLMQAKSQKSAMPS